MTDDPRSPTRALIAVGVGVVLLVLVWSVRAAGAWSLLLVPILALYVVNVYYGGGLNDSPLDGIQRYRDRDPAGPR